MRAWAVLVGAILIAVILLLVSSQAAQANSHPSRVYAPPPTPDCNAAPAPEVNWDDCEINKIITTNLNREDLFDSWMRRTDLSGLSMTGARLMRVDFTDADLSRTVLNNADLTDAILSGANLSGASLAGAVLRSTSIPGGFIFDANTNLNNVDLSGADLSGADLSGIDLGGVNLSGANLSGANLSGATTNNRTNFTGANLEGVTGLEPDMRGTFDYVTCPGGTVIGAGETCFAPTAIYLVKSSAHVAYPVTGWLFAGIFFFFFALAWKIVLSRDALMR
jgi:hypothetical protein